ncbi:MAG: sensor histidine kinase [Pseudomonadota bacterium]
MGADGAASELGVGVHATRRAAAIAVPVLLALAMAFWLSAPLFRAVRSSVGLDGAAWQAAANNRLTRLPRVGETPVPARRPGGLAPSGARQYGLSFDLAKAPDGDLAIYAPRGGLGGLFANRVPLPGEEVTATPSPVLLDRGGLSAFPRSYLHPGPNRADLVLDAGLPLAWPRGLLFGPRAPLESAHRRQAWLESVAPRLGLLTGGLAFLAGVFLALLQPGRLRRETLRPAMFAAVATAYVSLPLSALAGLPARWVWVAADLLPVVLGLFLVAWLFDEGAAPRLRLVLRLAAVILGALTLAELSLPGPGPWRLALESFAVVSTTVAALIGGWRILRGAPADHAAAAGAGLTILWLASAMLCRSTLLPLAPAIATEAVAAAAANLLLAGGLVVLVDQGISEGSAAWGRRRSLAARVQEQSGLIAEQQGAIDRELQRRAVLEERERLTRDIHDGIGGQLVSLLVRLKAGKIDQTDLEAEVQTSLNDLRLIIDSLDHASESFPTALALVSSRLRSQMEAAGVPLVWRQDGAILPDALDARSALDIFRTLQEGCTNILKHARADRAEIDIRSGPDGRGMVLSIADNGCGMPAAPDRSNGRGLRNLRRRAARVGAVMTITAGIGGRGTTIRMEFPPWTATPV